MTRTRFRRSALASAPSFDLGGTLAQVLPPLQVPYIEVQKSGPLTLDSGTKSSATTDKNILKMDDDLLKIRQDAINGLDLLPEDQSYLMGKLDDFSNQIYQQTTSNPQFFQNAANIGQVKNKLSQLVNSDEVKIMKQRATDARKYRDTVYSKNLQGNKFRTPDGRPQAFTNEEYINKTFNETGAGVRQMWGIGENSNRKRGQLELNSYTGTDVELDESLDKLSGLVRGSKISRSQGGYQMDPSVSAQFESLYPGIKSYLSSKSGESNTEPLKHLASFWGTNWKSRLPKPAAQALEDKMDLAFDKTGFSHEFKLKGGRAFGGNKASIGEIERMARSGEVENPQQILAQINSDRAQYVQQEGARYVVSRLMGTQYADSASSYTESMSVQGAGSLRKAQEDKAKAAEPNYERNLYEGNVDALATSVRGIDARGTNNWLQVSPTVQVQETRQKMYVGKSLDQAGFGRQVYSMADPTKNLLAKGLKNTSQMKVLSSDGDLLLPSDSTPGLKQAQQQYQDAQRKIAALQTKVSFGNQLVPSEQALLKQHTQELATATAALNTLTAQEKNHPYHKLTVVMPKSVLEENAGQFTYQEKDGTQQSMFKGKFGVDALWNVYQEENEASNPYGIKKITLTDKQKAALGYDADQTEFIQMDAAVDGSVQDMFMDKEQKGVNQQIKGERQAQRGAEIDHNANLADALNVFK